MKITDTDNRLIRHAAAARINAMQSEVLFLKDVHYRLTGELGRFEERIQTIEQNIASEKASVPKPQ